MRLKTIKELLIYFLIFLPIWIGMWALGIKEEVWTLSLIIFLTHSIMNIMVIYCIIASFLIFLCKFKVRNISWNYLLQQEFVAKHNKKQIKSNLDAIMWNEKLPKLYKKNTKKRILSVGEGILGAFITSAVIDGFSDSYNNIYTSYEKQNPIAEIAGLNSNYDVTDGGWGDKYSNLNSSGSDSRHNGAWSNNDSSSNLFDSDLIYDSDSDLSSDSDSDSGFDGGSDW